MFETFSFVINSWKNQEKFLFMSFLAKIKRPRQDSNLESSDPKSDALSIRPRGRCDK